SYGDEGRALAGGQSLVPLLNLRLARPKAIIDLNRIESLAYHRLEGDVLVVGALCRQRDLERDPAVLARCAAIADALPLIGHLGIRNRGTVVGSLAHADPAAEWPLLIFINIFGGIVRCERIAHGVIDAAKEVDIKLPVVVRLQGTNAEEGRKLLLESGLKVDVATDLWEAAQKIVAMTGKKRKKAEATAS